MNEELMPQARKMSWWEPYAWKLRNKTWWLFLPLMNYLHSKVSHCNEPEYFKAHPKLIRWTGGLKQFTWTWICGHNFGFSFHMGNIYWKLFGGNK